MKAAILLISAVLGMSLSIAFAQEPIESPTAVVSQTPTAAETDAPTPTSIPPEATATPAAQPRPASIAFRFAEEGRDTAPDQVQMLLRPWAELDSAIELRTDTSARAEFRNVPPGTYTIRIYWPAGFVQPRASEELPHILRLIVQVRDDGSLAVPDTLPATWPGPTQEPLDVLADAVVLGRPPETIVLGLKDPSVLSITTGTGGGVIAVGEGSIDVRQALARGVGLPDTGSSGSRSDASDRTIVLAAAGLALLGAFAYRQIRISRRRQ